ncbi:MULTISPECIES: hypothetical protein [unclassified Nocardioides]|uniref:hypothetical protein n=1 Tax=unclassified Nocardioides TaxID=2615069 RepID=UPI003610C508
MSTQTWTSTVEGRTHRVEADEGLSRRVRWYVDDELAAEKKSMDEKIRLEAPTGRLEVRFSTLGAPRRATVHTDGDEVDLVPAPGSKAARHEEAVRAHPERYAVIQTVGGVAKVVVPILLTVLLARFAFSLRIDLPLPDLPDLPSLPRPDLPGVPLPDLPDWSLPGWVEQVLDVAHYVWPVVLAYVLARAEIKRRRRQDEKRQDEPGASR